MLSIEYINSPYDKPFGIPRYNQSIISSMLEAGIKFSIVVPSVPRFVNPFLSISHHIGIDPETFFVNYPISAPISRHSIKHLSNHTFATLILIRDIHPSIVTVHDIESDWVLFKHLYRNIRYSIYRLFHRLSLVGLKKADFLITDTFHVKNHLINKLDIRDEHIAVIPLGVEHNTFKPCYINSSLLDRFNLDGDCQYILHVGTDAPRKNIRNLIRAFLIVKKRIKKIKLLKLGKPTWPKQFLQTQKLIEELGLVDDVVFINQVIDDELAVLYNLADVLVYPSIYEGFGLPILEAMACGTPVVTSNTSCLPEVAGGAAVLVDPYDVEDIADGIYRVLSDPDLADDLRLRGLARASQFSWERTARETIAVYERLLNR